MAAEIKSNMDTVRWPAGIRLPVMLTFEHQAGEGAPLFAGERPNYMVGGAIQYGARRYYMWDGVGALQCVEWKSRASASDATSSTNSPA